MNTSRNEQMVHLLTGSDLQDFDSTADHMADAIAEAERKATHNAVERQRREVLNGRFQDLALLIPALANNKKPSKSAIVTKSYEYIQELKARAEIRKRTSTRLLQENQEFKQQINTLRSQLGLPLEQFKDFEDEEAAFDMALQRQRELSSRKKRGHSVSSEVYSRPASLNMPQNNSPGAFADSSLLTPATTSASLSSVELPMLQFPRIPNMPSSAELSLASPRSSGDKAASAGVEQIPFQELLIQSNTPMSTPLGQSDLFSAMDEDASLNPPPHSASVLHSESTYSPMAPTDGFFNANSAGLSSQNLDTFDDFISPSLPASMNAIRRGHSKRLSCSRLPLQMHTFNSAGPASPSAHLHRRHPSMGSINFNSLHRPDLGQLLDSYPTDPQGTTSFLSPNTASPLPPTVQGVPNFSRKVSASWAMPVIHNDVTQLLFQQQQQNIASSL